MERNDNEQLRVEEFKAMVVSTGGRMTQSKRKGVKPVFEDCADTKDAGQTQNK